MDSTAANEAGVITEKALQSKSKKKTKKEKIEKCKTDDKATEKGVSSTSENSKTNK